MDHRAEVPGRVVRRLVLLAAVALPVAAAGAQGDPSALDVRRSRITNLASFVTAADGGAIPIALPPGRSGIDPMDFLVEYGHLFGVTEPVRQLRVVKTETDRLGRTHTTYAQVHAGVPVFSGVLKVHQNPAGQIIAANGDYYPISSKLDTTPTIGAAAAQRIAQAVVVGRTPEVTHSELVIVDPGWYGDPPRGAHLAHHLILTDTTMPLRQAFLVDAHSGLILDHWSMIDQVSGRLIHDAEGTFVQPGTLVRYEGEPPTGDYDADAAYDYAGDVLDYYFRAFERDGIDGAGMSTIVTVHFGVEFNNAFWDGVQLTFGTGWITDDIMGHEFTHGVTQYTANLIYQNQSGQLNESFSDVFGELVDLFNGDAAFAGTPGGSPPWPTHPTGPGTDTPNNLRSDCSYGLDYPDGVRWLTAEDMNGAGMAGAFRDMWDPTCFWDPDHANSPYQICDLYDSGGVHSGSGVPNHAFALVTDGGTFNGFAVNSIGPIKAGAIWYQALTVYLTSSSDFEDAYAALNQAAADLIGTTPNDPRTGQPSASQITAQDAAQVGQALMAVEMDTPGRCGQTFDLLDSDPPTTCSAQSGIFADDFESGVSGWTVSNSAPPTPYDWVQTNNLPRGRPGRAWFCEDRSVGNCGSQDESAVHSLFSPVFNLPSGLNFPVLSFAHYVNTEATWDGGNVKVRVNGGAWQLVPASAFYYNPYNLDSFPDNPLAGEPGFSGGGGGWGTSLVYLGDLADGGDDIQLRFDFGKDGCTGADGWYVDDMEVYDCQAAEDCNGNGIPDAVEIADGPTPDIILRNPPPLVSGAPSDADDDDWGFESRAEQFTIGGPTSFDTITIWGFYVPSNRAGADDFTVVIHQDDAGFPGAVITSESSVASSGVRTGEDYFGLHEWEITLTLSSPVQLDAGTYFVEIYNNTTGNADTFWWELVYYRNPVHFWSPDVPGEQWAPTGYNLAIEIIAGFTGSDCNFNSVPDDCEADCNANGVADECDLADGTSSDCNTNDTPDECDIAGGSSDDCETNGVPDECEFTDCNNNGTHDPCELVAGTSPDCNTNGTIDQCDIEAGASNDVNSNGIPDECENDCNANGVPDDWDISSGTSSDCNTNALPDECDLADQTSPDCNSNTIPDECDIAVGTTPDCDANGVPDECDPDCDGDGMPNGCEADIAQRDCNRNGVCNGAEIANCPPADPDCADCNGNDLPDECDIATGQSDDCDLNHVPDQCEFADCNTNGAHDPCDILTGSSLDCTSNGIPDECDISAGTVPDCDGNGVPDECEFADCNTNGVHDPCDINVGTSWDCNLNNIPDECDLTGGTSPDCNTNQVPDECDIDDHTSNDCDFNGVPDECEFADCNTNGVHDPCDIDAGTSMDCNVNRVPDACDIAGGTSNDVNGNDIPDECEDDCNANGVPDAHDIAVGASADCTTNGIPDECDIAEGTSSDCNTNTVPDVCDLAGAASPDCNTNHVPDECDVAGGTSTDCEGNGVPDECELTDCNTNGVHDGCDVAVGGSPDVNGNGVPDECDECLADADCNDQVNCNGVETCVGGLCVNGSVPCSDCNPVSDTCPSPGGGGTSSCTTYDECDDGKFCNGDEMCSNGECLAGADPCPDRKCDEERDTCVDCLTDSDCLDDGVACNGTEKCDANGLCQDGESSCAAGLVCDETADACVECLTDSDCGDDSPCTRDVCNDNSVCVNTPLTVCPDADGDGVVDDRDLCRRTAAGATVDADGCACNQIDEDGDGVNDCDDQCPGTAKTETPDDVGCPIASPPDEPDPPDGQGDAEDVGTDGGQVDQGAGDDDLAAPLDDGQPVEEPAGEAVPGGDDAEAGATSTDQQTATGQSTATSSQQRTGICGILGTINLFFVLAGLALLRGTHRR